MANEIEKMDIEPELKLIEDVIQGMPSCHAKLLKKFSLYVMYQMHFNSEKITLSQNCLYGFLSKCGHDVASLENEKIKEGCLLSAFWVIFLRYFKNCSGKLSLKYTDERGEPLLESFLRDFEGNFDKEDVAEQLKLLEFSNWISLMVPGLPVYRNKGLYLLILPKFLETFNIKYSIGSGQSRGTTNRCLIINRESGHQVMKRKRYMFTKYITPTEEEKRIRSCLFSSIEPLAASTSIISSSESPESESREDIFTLDSDYRENSKMFAPEFSVTFEEFEALAELFSDSPEP